METTEPGTSIKTSPSPVWGRVGEGADHLGNVRSVISSDTNQYFVAQATDYYPFGMEITKYGSSDNQLKYNSKELQTEADLEWYDYGARFYDPVLGRWHSVDPMAESSRRWSPYTYCMNNPIRFIDPDGMRVDEFEVYKDGLIVQVPKEGKDKVIIMDDNNQRTDIAVVIGDDASLKEYFDGHQTIEVLRISEQEKAKEAFKTISQNNETEFGLINYSDANNDGKSALITRCGTNEVPASSVAKSLFDVDGMSVNEILHNHSNNTLPSGFDQGTGEVKIPLSGDAKAANDYPTNSKGEPISRAVYKPDFGTINRYDNKRVHHEEKY